MIKSIPTVIFLALTGFSVSPLTFAQEPESLTVRDLAAQPQTAKIFRQMVKRQNLPEWIMQGGTHSPSQEVTIDGTRYTVTYACKPHDCASESIAVLYSPASKIMSGVFSSVDSRDGSQTLRWMNIPDELSVDGRTVLFAALTGSLENRPDSFSFK